MISLRNPEGSLAVSVLPFSIMGPAKLKVQVDVLELMGGANLAVSHGLVFSCGRH